MKDSGPNRWTMRDEDNRNLLEWAIKSTGMFGIKMKEGQNPDAFMAFPTLDVGPATMRSYKVDELRGFIERQIARATKDISRSNLVGIKVNRIEVLERGFN